MSKKRIKINTATVEQLQQLYGINSGLAGNIVRYRDGETGESEDGDTRENEKRYFHSAEDLAEVSGISRAKADKLKPDIDWRVPRKSRTINLCLDFCQYLQQSWLGQQAKRLHNYGLPVVLTTYGLLVLLSVLITVAGVQGVQGLIHLFFPNDPIRIDYEDNDKRGEFKGVIEDFDPSKGLGYYNDNNLIAFSSPFINIDVVSQVSDEWIKVAPYLVIATEGIEPVPETVDYVHPPAGGGGGSVDFFAATLSPDRDKIFGAPQLRALHPDDPKVSASQAPSDYFTLQPGEREVFQLTINMVPNYFYHYRIGVPYSYKGSENVKWIDRKFFAGQSTKINKQWIVSSNGKVVESPQHQLAEDMEKIQADKTDQIRQEEEAIQKYQTFFTLPQSGPENE